MELQGLTHSSARHGARAAGALAAALIAAVLLIAPPARAGAATTSATVGSTTIAPTQSVAVTTAGTVTATKIAPQAQSSGTPVLVTDKDNPPAGYRLTAYEVERIAARSATVIKELKKHPNLVPYEYTKTAGEWQVSWFTPPGKVKQKELIQVYVNDSSGEVTQAWTGFQVPWTMARGYPGAFGRSVNDWWLWVALSAVFMFPFLPWRRRPTLLHLDLLVLLGFSVSLAFFNHANLGMSVPLIYPPMIYLMARMIGIAFGKGIPREPLRVNIPVAWMVVLIVFLVGFRVGLNTSNSNVIDVGYAGVIGANKVIHGQPLYGNWPTDNANGDTYGPFNYYAYVPAKAIFGWSGSWDSLPAAHAAAILFDILTLLGLFWLGRRIRGPSTGVVLAYLWAAFPFTLYTLSSNSNDSLVAFMTVVCMLCLTSAPARGIAGALAGLTKFAPLGLGPLLLRGAGDWPGRSKWWKYPVFIASYVATLVLCFLPVLLKHDLKPFYDDSIKYQANRPAPFSVWGLWGGLSFWQHLVQGCTVALAILVAFFPRRRGIVEVAALGGAVIIAVQCCLTYWFYLYIPWFLPLVFIGIVCCHPSSKLLPAMRAYIDPEIKTRGIPILSEA